MTFTIQFLNKADIAPCVEWLNYAALRGLGQWRNSGKGRCLWDQLDSDGNVIAGNNEAKKKKKASTSEMA